MTSELTHDPRIGLPFGDIPPHLVELVPFLPSVVQFWVREVSVAVGPKSSKVERRICMICDACLYTITAKAPASITRCIPVQDIRRVVRTGVWLNLIVPSQFDLRLTCDDIREPIEVLRVVYEFSSGKELEVAEAPDTPEFLTVLQPQPTNWQLSIEKIRTKKALAQYLAQRVASPPVPPAPPSPLQAGNSAFSSPPIAAPTAPAVLLPPQPQPQPLPIPSALPLEPKPHAQTQQQLPPVTYPSPPKPLPPTRQPGQEQPEQSSLWQPSAPMGQLGPPSPNSRSSARWSVAKVDYVQDWMSRVESPVEPSPWGSYHQRDDDESVAYTDANGSVRSERRREAFKKQSTELLELASQLRLAIEADVELNDLLAKAPRRPHAESATQTQKLPEWRPSGMEGKGSHPQSPMRDESSVRSSSAVNPSKPPDTFRPALYSSPVQPPFTSAPIYPTSSYPVHAVPTPPGPMLWSCVPPFVPPAVVTLHRHIHVHKSRSHSRRNYDEHHHRSRRKERRASQRSF
eukprot:TRINITY_DN13558_c0_g1_i1.p1 TRINITY_DN13558_c0_g1~~TRINITY_DN13558_c0_g1_i1.p1  ORF type:complete len:516 (+),score=49.24 TRINITY_DN13558_c0_g1_i1:169-1716(+)